MPGQPLKRQFNRELARKAEELDLTDPDGKLDPGEVYFFGRVASGAKMGEIAEEFGVSRPWLYTWMKLDGRREVRERAYRAAQEAAADFHAEAAGDVLELGADPSTAEVSLAGKKSEYHRWLATVLDRERYGPKGQEVNVSLDLGQLHIQALQEVQAEWEEEAEVIEAEVSPVEDDDG